MSPRGAPVFTLPSFPENLRSVVAKIRDVARQAGVSAMTVSRTLNQPERVSPATRARVLAAVHDLGYSPNAVARSLTQGYTDLIALVVSDIQNPFFTTMTRGVEDVAQRHGYTLMVGNSDEQAEKERQYLEVLVSRRADGVILSTTGAEQVRLLQEHHIPVVLVDRMIPGIEVDSVVNDVYDGGRKLIEHLHLRGYRNVAFIGGTAENSTIAARLAGCRDAARQLGLSLTVGPGRLDRASGEAILASLCDEQRLPEAIIAANNLVAVGAMVELRRRGLRVPEDVGLACFGEIELASLLEPFLTVVREPAYEVGRIAMELLDERIRGSKAPPIQKVLPVELVARRSTQRP
jgi:LacI family transcriptional regulator